VSAEGFVRSDNIVLSSAVKRGPCTILIVLSNADDAAHRRRTTIIFIVIIVCINIVGGGSIGGGEARSQHNIISTGWSDVIVPIYCHASRVYRTRSLRPSVRPSDRPTDRPTARPVSTKVAATAATTATTGYGVYRVSVRDFRSRLSSRGAAPLIP